MTHEETQQKLNEYLAEAFKDLYTLAEIVGALEEVKYKIMGDTDFISLSHVVGDEVYDIVGDLPISEAVGMVECTKLAIVDNVVNAVTHKQNLAQLAESEH